MAEFSGTLPSGKQFYAGFSETLRICDLLEEIRSAYRNGFCLLTVVDSSPAVRLHKLMVELKQAASKGGEVTVLSHGVALSGAALGRSLSPKVLSPFSAGFFSALPFNANEALPGEAYTSDGWRFETDVPSSLSSAIDRMNASAFFADGLGLNFVLVKEPINEGIRRALLGL